MCPSVRGFFNSIRFNLGHSDTMIDQHKISLSLLLLVETSGLSNYPGSEPVKLFGGKHQDAVSWFLKKSRGSQQLTQTLETEKFPDPPYLTCPSVRGFFNSIRFNLGHSDTGSGNFSGSGVWVACWDPRLFLRNRTCNKKTACLAVTDKKRKIRSPLFKNS